MSEKATYLAVIAPLTDETRGLAASPETRERARMQVWGDVSAALEPLRGEVCGDLQPAAIPWEHPLEAPFSVVLGQSEAATFLLYYALANNAQQEQMRTVGDRLIAKGVTLMEKKLANDTIVQVVSYDGSDPAAANDVSHIKRHLTGDIRGAAGLYSLVHNASLLNSEQENQILSDLSGHAMCLVELRAKGE